MIMTDLIWTDNLHRQTIASVINGSSPYLLFLFWGSKAPLNHVIHPDGGLHGDLCRLAATREFALLVLTGSQTEGISSRCLKALPLKLIITVLIILAHIFRGKVTGFLSLRLWMLLNIEVLILRHLRMLKVNGVNAWFMQLRGGNPICLHRKGSC